MSGDTARAHYTLDGTAQSVAQARDDARAFLGAMVPPADADLVRDALLAVSELVTNAVRHAPGPCTLELSDDGLRLTIAVSDRGASVPSARPVDLDGGGGLGLHVLSAMAGGLRVEHRSGGKTVAVTLERRDMLMTDR